LTAYRNVVTVTALQNRSTLQETSMATAHTASRLAYDDEGAGTPVVLLHGLTFDRRSWWPIIERLGGAVRSIAIDLPAHGESHGTPPPLEQIPARLHELLNALAVERPIVVGHSMSGGLAAMYASAYPARGLVSIDNGPHIRPFAELVRRLEPALRGPGFAEVWPMFENSLGLERIPEPARSLVLATRGEPGRGRQVLGDGASQQSGRAPSVDRHDQRQSRRPLPERVRTANHRR
jgi:pimeloyl-ACP methyl ester carboxylesterase